jgi:transposase
MAFRELSVVLIREILRRWAAGESLRNLAAATGADRKTVRRYVAAVQRAGLKAGNGVVIDDAILDKVVAEVLPGAPPEIGPARSLCRQHHEQIADWVRAGNKGPTIVRRLANLTGATVPVRTLTRFIAEEIAEPEPTTMRLVDQPPGIVVEVDFFEVGRFMLDNEETRLYALACVAAYSRHTFIWPCLGTRLVDAIEGLEAAWAFFGGVFPVVVTDNPKPFVIEADPLKPTLNEDFLEYAQARGFVLDLARVRRPRDKPKVERTVSYSRESIFVGERFLDLAHARRAAQQWCAEIAGQRIHGTTRRRPLEAFQEELPLLVPKPDTAYNPATWTNGKVGRDGTMTVSKALYSLPHRLCGQRLRVRYDKDTVRFYDGTTLIKVHDRVGEGLRSLDPSDAPEGKSELVQRDLGTLQKRAAQCGEDVGAYAAELLKGPEAWTRARHVHRLLRLCNTYGAEAVNQACKEAAQVSVFDATCVQTMLEKGRLNQPDVTPPPATSSQASRFSRSSAEFSLHSKETDHES